MHADHAGYFAFLVGCSVDNDLALGYLALVYPNPSNLAEWSLLQLKGQANKWFLVVNFKHDFSFVLLLVQSLILHISRVGHEVIHAIQ